MREHPILVAALALALAATLFFGVRVALHAIYWSQHRDMPIEAWMTVGQVAQSYGVDRGDLAQAVGIEPGLRERLSLAQIAARTGRPLHEVEADLRAAIEAQRQGGATAP